MTTPAHANSANPAARRKAACARDAMEYKILYAVSFPLFLIVATLSRLTSEGVRHGDNRSILANARALAGDTLPMAFMG
jgi:hypothetical protein